MEERKGGGNRNLGFEFKEKGGKNSDRNLCFTSLKLFFSMLDSIVGRILYSSNEFDSNFARYIFG